MMQTVCLTWATIIVLLLKAKCINLQTVRHEDADAIARAVAGISMRKKIAKIIDLGTLTDVSRLELMQWKSI